MRYRKRVLKLGLLAVVMLFITLVLSVVLKQTSISSEFHIRNFYREPEDSLDVILIGASEMYTDYSAPIAYRDQGFTSYNLCYESAPACLYDSMLKEALKTQSPKLVVFEVNSFMYTEEQSLREAGLRNWLDNVKYSEQWAEDIREYVPEDERINYYFNFLKYHSAWSQVERWGSRIRNYCFMEREDVSMMKSFGTRTTNESTRMTQRTKPQVITDYGKQSLEELIKCCRDNGIEHVLFIRTPHRNPLPDETSDEFKAIIQGAGYDFEDFDKLTEDIGIDRTADFYNLDHMNIFGNEKFTIYFARYLKEHYDLPTEHSREVTELWDKCADYASNAFKILGDRTAANEDIQYNEYSDLSEKFHQHLLKNKERDDKLLAEEHHAEDKKKSKKPNRKQA